MKKKKLIYIAQFHETCGYSHAAHGYLKSIDYVSQKYNLDIKVLSISLDPKKLDQQYHEKNNKTSKDILRLIDKYHFKDQEEIDLFLNSDYRCIWHMTSVLPVIIKKHSINFFYKNLKVKLENIILGAVENYHILAWETDKLCGEYQSIIKNYKPSKIFAPSDWNRDTFSTVAESVTIPHLIEKKSKKTEELNLPVDLKNKFVALSVSEWTNRKNFDTLIKSFILEFSENENAVLIIKSSLPGNITKQDFLNQFSKLKNSIRTYKEKKSNIFVIFDYLSAEKMSFLYESCDIFCLSSFGEGFSLPTSEAVSFEKPVLCPKFGGHVDYLDSNNPFFTEGMWETVFDDPPYDSDGKWYMTSVSSTRDKLRLAYKDWKSGSTIAKKSSNKNTKILESGKFSLSNIGSLLLKNVCQPSTSVESRQARLKREIQNKTLKDKMSILKDSYKGEECYILNCGPSLLEYNREKLNNFLKDKLVFTVKQAFERHRDVSDFHFFNCSNLPAPSTPWNPHYENLKNTISVASSNYEEYQRWTKVQTSDIFFKIPIRTEINNEFLVRTGKIEEFLIKNNLTRPCGPGIMYETVLYTALHLGVKKIICLGWDLTNNKNIKEDTYQHFYGNTKNLINRGDILSWEIEETKNFSDKFYEWCTKNCIDLELASSQSALSEKIPRIKLEL